MRIRTGSVIRFGFRVSCFSSFPSTLSLLRLSFMPSFVRSFFPLSVRLDVLLAAMRNNNILIQVLVVAFFALFVIATCRHSALLRRP